MRVMRGAARAIRYRIFFLGLAYLLSLSSVQHYGKSHRLRQDVNIRSGSTMGNAQD
jgi:hypothetical protein